MRDTAGALVSFFPSANKQTRSFVHAVGFILIAFACSRIFLTGIGVFSRAFLAEFMQGHYVWRIVQQTWLDIWFFGDSAYYIEIATQGYPSTFDPAAQSSLGFFPLFPMLIACTKVVFERSVLSGFILANGVYLVGLVLLYGYTLREYCARTAKMAVLLCLFFPNSFVYSAIYSEGLFFTLALATVYCASRNAIAAACVTAALLTITRVNGIFIVVPLIYLIMSQLRMAGGGSFRSMLLHRRMLWLLIIPVPLVLYCLYMYRHTGDPFVYYTLQSNAWEQPFQFAPWAVVKSFLIGGPHNIYFGMYGVGIACFIGYLVYARRYLACIMLVSLLALPLAAGPEDVPLVSLPRFLLVVPLLYTELAAICTTRPMAFAITLGCLALANGMLMVAWANGVTFIA